MASLSERMVALRTTMKAHHIDAWIIPSSDPHQSEYVAGRWEGRAWLSGFTGSAGTLVVLAEQAALWTDGRYFIQAEQELQGTAIELMREGQAGVPALGQWLQAQLAPGARVGFDGQTMSLAAVRRLEKSWGRARFTLDTDQDLLASIWPDRPALPASAVFLHPDSYAGKTREQKLAQVRRAMASKGASHLLVSSLDDIAWLFNLRGADVDCNPVFLAYTLISADQVQLYTQADRIEPAAMQALAASGVGLRPYESIAADLGTLAADSTLQLDPASTSRWLVQAVPESVQVIEAISPSTPLKAVKNAVELAAMEDCHRRDGVAMVRFMRWLEAAVAGGEEDEVSLDRQLEAFRAEAPQYRGPSFPTIAGYGANGAICHYRAEPDSCLKLAPEGLLLVDSGGQYFDGTTDITRTLACGALTDEQRRDYTLVLKSHISLARARFKKGTRGIQLDMLARMPLWAEAVDFNHGTGHGVGYFLNVHEGPQSISPRWQDVPLQPGMLVTNEPGLYRAGSHGIRIENIMKVVEDVTNDFGQFYRLEPLTLAPIDSCPLEKTLLTGIEIDWLDHYHRRVWDQLSPLLAEDDRRWLKQATAPIGG